MIYSTRVQQQPKVNESHIHDVPKNNRLILFFFFCMGKVQNCVDHIKTMVDIFFFLSKSRLGLWRKKLRKQLSKQELQNAI